ncbi:TPA: plasmid SOS inhibition protein A [Klebsiella michiganensis]|nr:plasmid SOS inhibition protein A [Klebsiella michiganensis]
MVDWLAACVRHLAGRSGDTPAPPERQEKAGNPVIDWHYALSVAYATQGKLCLSPLTDAERLVLFPEVLLPEVATGHNRLPYHTCAHDPGKRAVVTRLYHQEEAARAMMAICAATPDTLRGVVKHWQHRISPDALCDMLAQWQENQPGLTGIRAARWTKKSPANLRPEYLCVA